MSLACLVVVGGLRREQWGGTPRPLWASEEEEGCAFPEAPATHKSDENGAAEGSGGHGVLSLCLETGLWRGVLGPGDAVGGGVHCRAVSLPLHEPPRVDEEGKVVVGEEEKEGEEEGKASARAHASLPGLRCTEKVVVVDAESGVSIATLHAAKAPEEVRRRCPLSGGRGRRWC